MQLFSFTSTQLDLQVVARGSNHRPLVMQDHDSNHFRVEIQNVSRLKLSIFLFCRKWKQTRWQWGSGHGKAQEYLTKSINIRFTITSLRRSVSEVELKCPKNMSIRLDSTVDFLNLSSFLYDDYNSSLVNHTILQNITHDGIAPTGKWNSYKHP